MILPYLAAYVEFFSQDGSEFLTSVFKCILLIDRIYFLSVHLSVSKRRRNHVEPKCGSMKM
jgi:hypothetical protein